MGNRACPLCFLRVPRGLLLAAGEKLACPACGTPLALSRVSRVAAALCGLGAAYLAARGTLAADLPGNWALEAVAAVLCYAFASSALLYFFCDLVVPPSPPTRPFSPVEK